MKTMCQRASLCAISLALVLLPKTSQAQTTPTPQGTFVTDSAVPTVISPSAQGSEFFVLNHDLSLLTHSTVDSSLNGTCAAPSGFSATSPTPRTFLNDTQNAYFTAESATSANAAVSGFSFINTGLCQPINGPEIPGGTPTYAFSSNDPYHGRYYVLTGFNGNGPDALNVYVNLNNALSGGNYVTHLTTVPLDTGAQYTSMVTDTTAGTSGYSLTAITELKTATSPGNLWIYNQSRGAAYKILGPGGVPLPAVGSFLIPAQTNGGGALLVLINQDNLTATNLSNPPLDTTPFTIIDLGQLIQTFSIDTTGGTITLPHVTQISATKPYFAMLGAAYDPVNRLVYAVVGGGSLTGVTGSVISYDPFHPGSPSETVVADISNIPFNFGSYPQLALSAASGRLQILTSNPAGLYSVGIVGTSNLAVAVDGSVFPDSNFKPTTIAANPLLGETYIASSSGQVDILKDSATKLRATFTINGPDIATTTQAYQLQATALYPTVDSNLRAAPVTITATPAAGTPFTVAAGSFANFGLNPSNLSINFPALGVYTLVASIPATTNYPAITSNPVNVTVASNFIAGVYPTTLSITAPANSTTTAVNVLVNLGGSTYAPTGYIDVKDGTGATVGTTYFNGGALVQPTTVAVTLAQGPNTLTATYSGDAQNAPATSPALQVSVGTTVTPTLALTVPSSAFVGNSVSGNVTFRSTTTNVPTGLVTIYGLPNGSTTPISLTTVTAAQAFTGGGASFSFTAPAAGTYEVYASYAGDTNYASATTAQQSLVTHPIPVNTTTVLTGSATQSPGVPFTVSVRLTSGTTSATPTGNVVVTAVLNSSGASTTVGSIPAAQAFATGGATAQIVIAAAGSYTVTANYSGDANFQGSSNSLAVSVGGTTIGTTVGLSGSTTQTVGSPFTLTVRLATQSTSSSTPSGNVVITAVPTGGGATTALATVTAAQALTAGGYATQVTLPAAGSYTVTAKYAGDTNFGSSSASLVITTTATGTTLSLSGSTSQVAGTAFPLTVRLASAATSSLTPSGNVVITAVPAGGGATTTLATVTAAQALASGGYAAQVTLSTAGSYTVTANYAGDSNFAGSSASLVFTVASSRDVTTLTVSAPSNVLTGDKFVTTVTLKASGPNTNPITGIVTLSAIGVINSQDLGTVKASDALASGGVQITGSILISGPYKLQAVYLGDTNYQDSVGNGPTITVSLLTTSLGLSGATNQVPGAPFPLTVRLTAQANPTKTPTGNVLIRTYEGTTYTTLATIPVAQAMASGGYQAQITLPASASYTVTATYAGDQSFDNSTASLVVNTASSASLTLRSTVAAPVVNVPFTLCVDLASKTITATPTGNFTIGAVDPSLLPVSYPPVSAGSSLAKMACTPAFSVSKTGTWVFSATYPGDSNYPGLQASLTLNVQPQATTLKLVGAATAVAGSPYQVVTTLASPNTAPEGNVTLSATLSGSTTPAVTLSIDAKTAVTGTTSFFTFPSAGTYTVTASYPGSDITAASASPALTVVVAPPPPTDFTLTLDDPSVDTSLGSLSQTAPNNTTTVTLMTTGVGPGPVTLSAAGSYPGVIVFRDAITKKLITTATPTMAGTKVIVEYDKAAPTAALQMLDLGQHPVPFSLAGGLIGLVCMAFRRSKIRRMRGLSLLSAVALMFLAAQVLSGCGATKIINQVNLTATPVTPSTAAPPQSVIFEVNAAN